MRHGFGADQTTLVVLGILTVAILTLTMDVSPSRVAFVASPDKLAQNTVPSLQVKVGCDGCSWSSSLSRRLAEGYLNRVMASGLAVNDREVVEVVIHKIDRAAGLVHASASFSDISFALTTQQSVPNRGIMLRQMGAELAEKLAVELYR